MVSTTVSPKSTENGELNMPVWEIETEGLTLENKVDVMIAQQRELNDVITKAATALSQAQAYLPMLGGLMGSKS